MTEKQYPADVTASAHDFRIIMSAVSRPGRILPFGSVHQVPAPFWTTASAVARTLCDFQTPIWLAAGLSGDAIKQYIRFHTGAPITDKPEEAAFIFLEAQDDISALSQLALGTHEYPDRSATLVIQTASLTNAGEVELSGPGIPLPLKLHAEGVPKRFWEAMAENHAQFPLGVDVIFVSPDAIAAVPRSTAIHMQETV